MKLNYRGVSYEYNPPVVATNEGGVAGKFRGLDWRFRNLEKPPVLQPPVNLTYRGVAYNNRPTSNQEQSAVGTNIREKARYQLLRKEKAVHHRAASMFFRTANEVGLV